MLLSSQDSWILHHLRNLLLIILSLFALPYSGTVVILARLLRGLSIIKEPRIKPQIRNGRQIRVLISGVGMAKGLFLCRSFHLGGCYVVAADFRKPANVPCGRFSAAVNRYYSISSPAEVGIDRYLSELAKVIVDEQIDLYVTCSGVATAMEDSKAAAFIEKATTCKAFQLHEAAIRILDDKFEFMKQTDSLGMSNPEWYSLQFSDDIPGVLEKLKKKPEKDKRRTYIVKSAGMDDNSRGAIPLLSISEPGKFSSVLGGLDLAGQQWIVQEYFPAEGEFCTHAVVVKGEVKAFTACPSSSVLMHYKPLEGNSWQYRDMLAFTKEYASALYKKYGQFTGHLSFDFRVRINDSGWGQSTELVPIECNPRCHTATVLFRGQEAELTAAYMSTLHGEQSSMGFLQADKNEIDSFYWTSHDLVALFILPTLQVISSFQLLQALENYSSCIAHFFTWKDPTFEWWDPLPWFVLNHIYWPLDLLMASINSIKWKQLNVSTTKMFKC